MNLHFKRVILLLQFYHLSSKFAKKEFSQKMVYFSMVFGLNIRQDWPPYKKILDILISLVQRSKSRYIFIGISALWSNLAKKTNILETNFYHAGLHLLLKVKVIG